MTTATASWTHPTNSDALWRGAIQSVSEMLDDLGLTLTSATDQVNYGTITTSTTTAYEQRTWATSGDDMCLRVTYTLTSNRMAVSFDLGSGFPAAASTVPTNTIYNCGLTSGATGSTSEVVLYGCVDGDRFTAAAKDNLNPTSRGSFAAYQRVGSGSYACAQSNAMGTSVNNLSAVVVYSAPGQTAGAIQGNSVSVWGYLDGVSPNVEFQRWPVRPANGAAIVFPDAFLSYKTGLLTEWTPVTVSVDGVDHTYLPVCVGDPYYRMAVRYE